MSQDDRESGNRIHLLEVAKCLVGQARRSIQFEHLGIVEKVGNFAGIEMVICGFR